MYICICQAVTDREIKAAVKNGVDTFSALQDCLGVASQCGRCKSDVEKILDQTYMECRCAKASYKDFKNQESDYQ